MVRFGRYAAASAVGATGVIFHAFNSREQFYPAMLYLATSKVSLVLLLNMALVIICGVWQLVKTIFLGPLREIEVERLNEQLWREVMEILFAMTVFRDEFNVSFVTLIIVLLFIKAFHWLAQTRVEYIETTPSVSRLAHARIISFMAVLLTMDCLLFNQSFSHLLKTREASVSLFFAFEYIILATATVATFVKYSLYLGDMIMDGQWDNKAIYVFYLELVRDLLHLSLYLFFFLVIFRFKGLPLHLVRELYETFRNFKTRVADFIRYRNVTSNMNVRFPDATPEELTRSDATCIICREEMSAAKKLPCGHLFHIHCLRSWLERQQTCPTCRSSVLTPEGGGRVGPDPAAGPRQVEAGLDANAHGNGANSQAPSAASVQQERLHGAASSAAAQYQSSYVYPTMRADGSTWYHPAYLAFVPQAYLAAMVGGGPSTSTSTRASSGLEEGNQGIRTGVTSEPMPTSQAQFWQAWAQMRMAASPASYTQWQSAAGSSQIPSWAISSQVPVQGQSMDSSTTAEFSQAAQPNMDGSERSGPDASMNSEGNSPASLHAQQVHLKQWIEVLEKQLSSAIERQTQLSQEAEATTNVSKEHGESSEATFS
ncbi:unnamed protein product [Calypogeia fissa]